MSCCLSNRFLLSWLVLSVAVAFDSTILKRFSNIVVEKTRWCKPVGNVSFVRYLFYSFLFT